MWVQFLVGRKEWCKRALRQRGGVGVAHVKEGSYACRAAWDYPDWLAKLQEELLTDTGVHFARKGFLALCTAKGSDHIAIVSRQSRQVTAKIKVWSHCEHCGEVLLDLLPSDLQPSALRVSWDTGFCTEMLKFFKLAPTGQGTASKFTGTHNGEAVLAPGLGPKTVSYTCGREQRRRSCPLLTIAETGAWNCT